MIRVKNKSDEEKDIRFDLLDGVLVPEEDIIFENEEALGKWIDSQSVEDEPLWKYLLKNHFRYLNAGEDILDRENYLPLREHVLLQMIARHPLEILEDSELEHLSKHVEGALQTEIIKGMQEEKYSQLGDVLSRLNDSNKALFADVISPILELLLGNHGKEFLDSLDKSGMALENKAKVFALMLDMNPLDDDDGQKKQQLQSNIHEYILKDKDLFKKVHNNYHVSIDRFYDVDLADSSSDQDISTKKLAAILNDKVKVKKGESRKSKVFEMAIKEKDYDKASKLFEAVSLIKEPRSLIRRKINKWAEKVGGYKKYKKAKSFADQLLKKRKSVVNIGRG